MVFSLRHVAKVLDEVHDICAVVHIVLDLLALNLFYSWLLQTTDSF